jgi:hypothetical protein
MHHHAPYLLAVPRKSGSEEVRGAHKQYLHTPAHLSAFIIHRHRQSSGLMCGWVKRWGAKLALAINKEAAGAAEQCKTIGSRGPINSPGGRIRTQPHTE